MKLKWIDCDLIFDKDFTPLWNNKYTKKWNKFISIIGKQPDCRVWYDTIEDMLFGNDITSKNSKDNNYLLAHSMHDSIKLYGKNLNVEFVSTNEIYYQRHDFFSRICTKKVLVIGAGPTAVDLSNINFSNYDLVLSCNSFFKHKDLKNQNIDYVSISNETDLNNVDLCEYLDKFATILGFVNEIHKPIEQVIRTYNKYYNRCILLHQKISGKIGAVPRLIHLVAYFGAKSIDAIGFDGVPKHYKFKSTIQHAFDGMKQGFTPYTYNHNRRQFVLFWDYMLTNFNNVKYKNLGQGRNMWSDISEKEFV